MNVSAHTTMLCSHCYTAFRVPAWRVASGSSVECRNCGGIIVISSALPEHSSVIADASDARKSFRKRRRSYESHHLSNAALLARLDQIAERLDKLATTHPTS
ncbi:hypothetical protein GCM10007989_03360 [Devosia pacifica]|uniref:Uncharacterized protein n=1 Tax=Devosia pacifica TaxID=1335967 RepID=A0A918VP87_9HYPH|nr:hypothetical protein GCM10007989_03360 [Devosia pacifica]